MKPDIDAIRLAVQTVYEGNNLLLETGWRGLDNAVENRNQAHRLEVLELCDYAEELENRVKAHVVIDLNLEPRQRHLGIRELGERYHDEKVKNADLTAMIRELVDRGTCISPTELQAMLDGTEEVGKHLTLHEYYEKYGKAPVICTRCGHTESEE